MAVLPMFPLGSVLLPGMVLPLHVFEERYQALVRDCLAGDRRFGVVLIERGSEVGGGEVRSGFGTAAELVEAEPIGEGRWSVVAVGVERIRVSAWLEDDPYPRAEVSAWPDPAPVDPALCAATYAELVSHLRRVVGLAVELGAPPQALEALGQLHEDPALGSFQVALLAPLGALDRQRVLAVEGVELRLALLRELCKEQELVLQARLGS